MRTLIQDEFTNRRISRQRKYQMRKQRDRRCTECGEPAKRGSRCLKHLIKARERQRKARGLKRRYFNTISYKLQGLSQARGRARGRSTDQSRAKSSRGPSAAARI